MRQPTFDQPSTVTANDGRVQIDGPGSVDIAMTPEAAEITGSRLIDAAAVAHDQQHEAEDEPEAERPDA